MNTGFKLFLTGLLLLLVAFVVFGIYMEHDRVPPRWVPVLAGGAGLTAVVGAIWSIWSI